MGEKDNFGSGFLLGTIIGGVVGGVLGAIASKKVNDMGKHNNDSTLNSEDKGFLNNRENVETARLSLEEKINQLNHAIDDVRVTLIKNSELETENN
ncbi:hypothetical protein A5482_005885 [Cyanobacterium sp. IPPAS B-1200]|uniref:hypothetical protein n=1 Tax=Cyanobacterium sp. IPPAS B-1200 TaxID=1562720 RepID=UPI0008526E4E|nr:hypothetical protein [Cyanobacterium sp. IPPAS B-1200]OEJ78816.1 hypothetical protein A5482_02815 [Cyanobacterium sp. IPPAS B-1200]